jgi:hypothetical protein
MITLVSVRSKPIRTVIFDDPHVFLMGCNVCGARFYGQALLRTPACPSCGEGTLQQLRVWDLRVEPLRPFIGRVQP